METLMELAGARQVVVQPAWVDEENCDEGTHTRTHTVRAIARGIICGWLRVRW